MQSQNHKKKFHTNELLRIVKIITRTLADPHVTLPTFAIPIELPFNSAIPWFVLSPLSHMP